MKKRIVQNGMSQRRCMKMNMTITNPRRSRRELAEQWSQYRSGVKLCIKQGLYEAGRL